MLELHGRLEVAQLVRAPAALAKDLHVVPSTHAETHSCLTTDPGDAMLSSALHGPQEHAWCTYIHVGRIFGHGK